MSRFAMANRIAARSGQARIDNAMPEDDDEDQGEEEDFVEPDFDDNQISNYYDGT